MVKAIRKGMVTLVLVTALWKLCSTLDIKVHKYATLPCATCINYALHRMSQKLKEKVIVFNTF